jgi:hypothetical protein
MSPKVPKGVTDSYRRIAFVRMDTRNYLTFWVIIIHWGTAGYEEISKSYRTFFKIEGDAIMAAAKRVFADVSEPVEETVHL